MIQLGSKIRDRITGFEGVVTGRVEYLTGCNQVLVAPRVKADGGHLDSCWFDEQRCDVLPDAPVKLNNGQAPGFDRAAPIR